MIELQIVVSSLQQSLIKIDISVILKNIKSIALLNFIISYCNTLYQKYTREIHSETNFKVQRVYNYMAKHTSFLVRKIRKA